MVNKSKHKTTNRNIFEIVPGWCFLMIISISFCIVGCSSEDDDETDDLTIASVRVLPDDEPLISLGQEVILDVIALNAAGMEVPKNLVLWSNSNPDVVEVTLVGRMTGLSAGTTTITANAEGVTASMDFRVVDLSGTWVGGELPDTVSYVLTQTGDQVNGVFHSRLGFPPITDVTTGMLTGDLLYDRYNHTLELTTETGCVMRVTGAHTVEELPGGELILTPGSGSISSPNCSIGGTIDFATLRRE